MSTRFDPTQLAPPLARLPEEWAREAPRFGGRPFHGKQIFRWIQARGVTDPARMSDLPQAMRERLSADGVGDVARVSALRRADDATRKLLVAFADGSEVETVLIPRLRSRPGELPAPVAPLEDADATAADEDDDDDAAEPHDEGARASEPFTPVTQCISTQVGCAMGCVFCASGVAGLKRHLGPDEIVAQVLAGRAHLEPNERLRNVVIMGMGEPLHNYDATVRALRLLIHADGIALSSRRVTVSTSGLVPEIRRLGEDFQGNMGLAISLHAADDDTRSRLMPINRKYPLAELMRALHDYPLPRRRRITIEYTLVSGKNDTLEEAAKVSRLLRGLPVKVNLIPMNPIEASDLGPPGFARVLEFQKRLCDDGYSCFIRKRRGDDVAAACGQLALLGARPKVRSFRAPG